MITLVQKYGGTSVESPAHLLDVAHRVLEQKRLGHNVIIVVSAMGQSTDDLIALARNVSASPPRREMDMLLTAGERIAMALLAIALDSIGMDAISFTGSQSGIITDDRHSDARITEIRPIRIREELERGRVVIVAGFQGVSTRKEVTTLGRGGSDTTAVALAVHFGSPWCEIYTDVHGVKSADPRLVPAARTVRRIDHESAIILSHMGAQVLFRRAVILARKYNLPLRVCCSLSEGAETWIGDPPEEVIMSQPAPMESNRILSVALEPNCMLVEVTGQETVDELLTPFRGGGTDRCWTWIDFTSRNGLWSVSAVRPVDPGEEATLREQAQNGRRSDRVEFDLAVVSLVGEGILASPELAGEAIACLRDAAISPVAVRTASLTLSFVVTSQQGAEAVRRLHARFVEAESESKTTNP